MVDYNIVYDVQFIDESTTEPVTLTEAKNFCKVDISNDDDLITALITAARQMCEKYTNIGFIEREVVANVNNVNGGILLPYGPISEVYDILDDEGKVIDTAEIQYGGNEFKRLIYPEWDNLSIDYYAGYGELPKALKTALLNQIYYLYDNRAQAVDDISPIAQMLLNPYKRNV